MGTTVEIKSLEIEQAWLEFELMLNDIWERHYEAGYKQDLWEEYHVRTSHLR